MQLCIKVGGKRGIKKEKRILEVGRRSGQFFFSLLGLRHFRAPSHSKKMISTQKVIILKVIVCGVTFFLCC